MCNGYYEDVELLVEVAQCLRFGWIFGSSRDRRIFLLLYLVRKFTHILFSFVIIIINDEKANAHLVHFVVCN